MAGNKFKERVLIPLIAILGTIGGLVLLGSQLLGLSGASDEASIPAATVITEPTITASDGASASPTNTNPSDIERLEVVVLNGTIKVGYAKKVADELNFEDWVIKEVGNWDGEQFSETMVFYPAGYEEAGKLLAASPSVNGMAVPAEGDFSAGVLTIILAK